MAVAGEADVELDAVGAEFGGGAEGAQRVFRIFSAMASVGEDLEWHLLIGGELVAPGFALEGGLAVLTFDLDFELANGFAGVNTGDFGGGGDGITDKDRGGELPHKT